MPGTPAEVRSKIVTLNEHYWTRTMHNLTEHKSVNFMQLLELMREFIGKTSIYMTQKVILKSFQEVTFEGDHDMEDLLMLVHKCLLDFGGEQVDFRMEDIIEPYVRTELAKSVCLKDKMRQYHVDGFITDDNAAGLHEMLLMMAAEICMRTIIAQEKKTLANELQSFLNKHKEELGITVKNSSRNGGGQDGGRNALLDEAMKRMQIPRAAAREQPAALAAQVTESRRQKLAGKKAEKAAEFALAAT